MLFKGGKRLLLGLGNQDASSTGSLDALLSLGRKVASLDNAGEFRETTFTKDLSITTSQRINDWDVLLQATSSLGLLSQLLGLFRDQRPQIVQVDNGAMVSVAGVMEVTHPNLAEVSWVETVQVGAVMMLTTGHTTTTRMLTMLTNTTMTGTNVSALLTILSQASSL